MSLLQKASIITTPTAYAEDYLYSIKPAYALGSELVTNGNFSDGTNNWVGNSDTTLSVTNKQLDIQSGDGDYGVAYAVVNFIAGKKYQIKLDVISCNVPSQIRVGISNSITSGSHSDIYNSGDIGIGSHTKFYTATATETYLAIGGRDDVDTLVIDNVSVKEVTDADFDFDRNSTGTRVNEDYLIEDVPYNLFTRSEDFSNGAYSKFQASVAETTIQSPISNSFVESLSNTSTGTTFSFINQGLTGVNAQVTSTFSVFAKKGTYNRLAVSNRSADVFAVIYDLDNGTIIDTHSGTGQILATTIQSVRNNFYLCSVTLDKSNQYNIHPIPSNISSAFSVVGNLSYTETGNINIFGAQAVKGSNLKPYLKTTDRLDIPRIDYTNGEPSILLEPSRTNTVTYSQDFSQWTNSNSTDTANATISPEGISNATNFSENTSNAQHKLSISATFDGSSTYTFSVFVKTNGRDIFLDVGNSTRFGGRASFNLTTGVATSVMGTSSIENFGNGWFRCMVTGASTSAGSTTLELLTFNGSTNSYEGDGTSGVFVYGAQLEAGSYETSLIHTSGSTVTRSQDAANNAGNSDLINSTEGVLYGEIKALANDGTSRHFSINDGTAANKVEIYYDSTTNEINGHINVSGASSAIFNQTFATVLEYHKVAVKYKANDFSMFVDGTQIATDTSGVVFPANTLNNLAFDKGNATLDFYANVKSVMVFKEALTDLELAKLTGYNNHELYMNYYNRLSYLGLVEEYNVESDINNYIL